MKKNHLIRKGLVCGIILLFVGASTVPSIITDTEKKKDTIQFNELRSIPSSTTDWWPMFHHDLSHSGYSTSSAPETNTTFWTNTADSFGSSCPTVANGKVYIGSMDSKIYCFNAEHGTKIWNYTTGNQVYSCPAVADGKVYVGSGDGKVYCLNAENGTKIWDYTTGFFVLSSPAIDNGKVYIGSNDHKVYCLNAENGTKIWDYTTGWAVVSSPTVANGKVYIGSNDNKVYCLNAENGTKIWDYATGEWVESSPAVINGKVYIGSDDNKMYCLNAENGTKIWDYTTDHFVCSSPAVADGKVYIGSVDNKVYCLNAENGTKIWDYTTGDSVFSSPAVADGKVYVGSWDGKIYCFGSQYPPPITGPSWGLVNVNYTFCINVTDTDGDDIYCIWNWGDGNTTDWLGPYSSGGTICASHTWSQKGTYGIRVKLKDVSGQESDWSDPHVFNVYELKKAFIFGRYTNMTSDGEFITVHAVNLRMISCKPFQLHHYIAGETITYSENTIGALVTPRFLIGLLDVVT